MHQVRYFLAVCEHLNFTRAAAACHVSQPSLTRAVKKLEDELGGLLFRRERNQTHITELGRLMCPHLERIYEASETAREQAQGFQRLDHAPLELGLLCTVAPSRLISLMARLRQEVPNLDLSLRELDLQNLIDQMNTGDLEVAMLATPIELPERFDFIPLYKERYVVAFPPGHRFEAQPTVRIKDMHQESYLSRIDCEYVDYLDELLADQNVTLNIKYRTHREDWIQSMILAGMGCAFMPEYLPVLHGLPTRVVTEPDVIRDVGLVTIAGRRFSPTVSTFVRLARQHAW